jgi:phage/plasmid-like protein (TIGR03299 family)
MMYVGETPWHKLGQKLNNPATSEEAIVAAGLDYQVEKRALYINPSSGNVREVPNHFATVRMDTMTPLGVVGARYTPIQNRDAFRFFDALVGEGEAIYHTAGVLGKGEQIWIMAKLPGYIKVGGNDIVDKYLLLTNSHDGSSVVRAKLTPIRVVCNNTLSAALAKDGNQEVRIRHTANAVLQLEQAHKLLGLSNDLYAQLETIFNQMKRKTFLTPDLKRYVEMLVPDNKEADSNTRTELVRNKIYELHETGKGAELAYGTAWGAYNAVTEYTDHVMGSRDSNKALKSMWFGGGEALKHRAFSLAMQMCN